MSGYVGLIGSTKAQQALGKMLETCNNKRVVNTVTNRLFDFKRGCKVISKMIKTDAEMAEALLNLWKEDSLKKMQTRQDLVGEEIMTFWRNCLLVDYRKTLEKIRKKEE